MGILQSITCPLCQFRFSEQEGCRSCGLVHHCELLRCPHCGYEFVETSKILSFFSRWLKSLQKRRIERKASRGTLSNS